MTSYNQTEEIEALASSIGDNIYIDVAKWHLYLSDAHLHTTVAERLYPLLENNTITEGEILSVLQNISVQLGGGKTDIPLADLITRQGQSQLLEIVEEYQRQR